MLLAEIFNSNKIINDIENDVTKISQVEKDYFINLFDIFLNKILGLNFKKDKINNDSVLEILLKLRDNARKHKDYKLSDSIRDELAKIGINLNDKD
jgi:cysteinyl-tRNA synthetase